ncbi:MAG TPA: nuclear transport factor 2 family protein [Baekduia sp.]|uniref:nuclear transport factor 2 family protein n=1 Tax=Baekduia sp. TaxID=2600305 RepID=UPI002D7697AB|nr:nuclear transport factor 2 family protein [Baekduia sp.]HET6506351.1 nuclear transport factor 2 family protein [Baekduia sp.]
MPADREALLREMYALFNARDVDALLATMAPDVDWPNGWEGGRVSGHEAVREYWTRQWAEIDPRVEPLAFARRDDGRVAITVEQTVRSLDGALIAQDTVIHTYTFDDATGLIAAMEIEAPA